MPLAHAQLLVRLFPAPLLLTGVPDEHIRLDPYHTNGTANELTRQVGVQSTLTVFY